MACLPLQAGESVFRRVGVSAAVERIHRAVVPIVGVSRAVTVNARVVLVGHRVFGPWADTMFRRIAVGTDVVLLSRIFRPAGVGCGLRCIWIKLIGTLQSALVFETLCSDSFFPLGRFRVELFGLCSLTISLSRPCVGVSLRAFGLSSLLLDFGLSGTNIVFGLGSLLPNLRGLFPLVFALLSCRLAADCDDDPDDDQNHDDRDDNPDHGCCVHAVSPLLSIRMSLFTCIRPSGQLHRDTTHAPPVDPEEDPSHVLRRYTFNIPALPVQQYADVQQYTKTG